MQAAITFPETQMEKQINPRTSHTWTNAPPHTPVFVYAVYMYVCDCFSF